MQFLNCYRLQTKTQLLVDKEGLSYNVNIQRNQVAHFAIIQFRIPFASKIKEVARLWAGLSLRIFFIIFRHQGKLHCSNGPGGYVTILIT